MPQKILFPMEYMNITTGVNEASHIGSNAIDCAGSDSGIDYVNAPFTGVIKKIWANGNTVWLESLEPVEYADGTIDFATASFTHDNNVSDLKVGQVIQQWQIFYQEGTAGNANGNHIHLEVGRGKFSGTGWHLVGGNWVINNSYLPYNAFFLKDETIVINGHGYPWRKVTQGGNNMAGIDATDLTAIYELGPLGRSRSPGEGENVYLGKTANFVLRDHRASKEGQDKAAGLAAQAAAVTALQAENAQLKATIAAKDKEIADLKAQLAAGGTGKYTKAISSGTDLYIKVA